MASLTYCSSTSTGTKRSSLSSTPLFFDKKERIFI
jgi:hypothetical protein